MLAAGLNFSGVNPLAAIGIFTITTIALSLLFTRAFLAAGGAVLVPVIMHASFNSFSATLTITDHLSGNPLVVNPRGLVGIALLLLTVLAAHALRRRKARPQSMAAPLAATGRSAG